MRIDLVRESFEFCREQEFFLFLETMLDAGVVPDLDRRGDGQHGCEHDDDEPHRARGARRHEEEAVVARAEQLADDLEADRREQQHDLPVHLQRPEHLPGAPVEAGEDERRELPEDILGAQLAEAAAGEPAADGERQGDEFLREERGDADHHPDGEPRVRAVDQARQKRAFEREIGGLVAQNETRHHAQRQQAAQAQGEGEPVGRRPLLEDQEVPKPAEPHQNRRRGRHHGQFHHQRREQHLVRRESIRPRHRFTLILSAG